MKRTSQSLHPSNLVIFILSLIILIITLWGPIGLRNTPTSGEGWSLIGVVEQNDNLLPAKDWPTRPLRWLPYLIAFKLAPDSLIGFNIYLMSMFVLRGIATYLIFSQLFPNKPKLVFMTALFYLIYPIGTGFYDNNTINLQTSLVFGLFSIFTLLYYWRTGNKWLWVLIFFTQIISLLTYELFYLVFGIVPILFWWLDGRITISRRFIYTTGLWYSSCAVWGIRTLLILTGGSKTYIINNAYSRTTEDETPFTILSYTTPRLYSYHAKAWLENFKSIDWHVNFLPYIILASILISLLILLSYRRTDEPIQQNSHIYRRYLLVISYAFLYMFVALLPYSPLMKNFATDWRIFFLPTLGAAFMTAFVIWGIQAVLPLKRFVYSILVGLLLIVGVYYQAEQLHQDTEDTLVEKQLFADIIQHVPDTDGTIIILRHSDRIYQHQWFWEHSLSVALSYIADEPRKAFFCNPTNLPDRISCKFTEDGLNLYFSKWDSQQTIPYNDVIIFYINNDGSIAVLDDIQYYANYSNDAYQPYKLIKDVPYPERAYTYFDCFPLDECDTKTIELQSVVEENFNEPVQGLNFPAYLLDKEQGKQWMSGSSGVLTYTLENHQAYVLEFYASMIDESRYDNLQVKVNGQFIKLIKTGSGNSRRIIGFIPENLIDNTTTSVEFRIQQPPNVSDAAKQANQLLFDWLKIRPYETSELQPQSDIRFDFDEDVIGENWSPPSNDGWTWSLGNYSTLYLPLIANDTYAIEFMVSTLKPEIMDSLTLSLNDVPLQLNREDTGNGTIFRGILPKDVVSEFNLLGISVDETVIPAEVGIGADTRELGLYFDWMEIKATEPS